jgi:hypothetical protein
MNQSRRRFASWLALSGAGSALGLRPQSARAEQPPETTRLRIVRESAICMAPGRAPGRARRRHRVLVVRAVTDEAAEASTVHWLIFTPIGPTIPPWTVAASC